MKPLIKLLIMILMALVFLAIPVQAQEATPDAPPAISVTVEVPTQELPAVENPRDWLFIVIAVLLTLFGGVGLTFLGVFLRQSLKRDQALSLADQVEVSLTKAGLIADNSLTPWDDFVFAVSEPAVRRFIQQLRDDGEHLAANALAKAAGLPTETTTLPHR